MELIIIIAGILLDRITKIWAAASLLGKGDIVIINGFFSLSYLENRGAAFGIFQNRVYLLAAVTMIVLLGMVYYLLRYKPESRLLRISFAMIISGGLGNLYDRIVYNYVVDFIMFHYKDVYYFPSFNVADMTLVAGTGLLLLYLIKEETKEGKDENDGRKDGV
ncbi:MAG: lspA [Firmicutes bacterium]|nr:lspA [Bacillota bacterium]